MHNEVDDDDDDLLDEPLIEINPLNKSSNHMCMWVIQHVFLRVK